MSTDSLHVSALTDDDSRDLLQMKQITALDISSTRISDFSIRHAPSLFRFLTLYAVIYVT